MTDFYMSSALTSRYGEKAQYKGFAGSAGANTRVANVWVEHFECGFWMGDYVDASQMTYTDGMVIENARIRNNFADGVNFAQGTANSTVRNSSVRGNGDDGLASWSSIDASTNSQARVAEANSFVDNTIELGWRASGIGIFGGKSHLIRDNLLINNFSGAGIRLNTVFDGHNFDLNTDSGITLRDNKRDDEAGYTAKSQVVNYAQVDGLVVRGIPETDDFSLYWFQGEESGPDGTTHRYWVSKADGVELTSDMEYTQEGGVRVYNVTTGDAPSYLPVSSTDFSGSYSYVGDLARSQPADDGTTIVIRFWSAK